MQRFALTFLLLLCIAASPARAQASFTTALATTPGSAADAVSFALRAEALDWADTPHTLGGDSRRGIDCSGLMQNWYSALFGIQLPRTSGEQFAAGSPVERDALRPGDLVFFGSKRGISHVGTYVGEGEFAHVSSSAGVTVSRLDEAYWKRRYRGARRVLSADAEPSVALARGEARPAVPVEVAPPAHAISGAPSFTGASAPSRATAPATRRVGW